MQTLELRPRQQWAAHKLFEAMRAGHRKVLFVMPTGAGKRYLAIWLCQMALEKGRRVLFVTNRRLLVEQMFRGAGDFGVEYGVIMAGENPNDSPIQIASLQTLQSRYIYDRFGIETPDRLPPADLIIIDEAHQQVPAYMHLISLYANDPKVVGLTATPVGPEGRSLIPPYDILVEGCLNSELIQDGRLLPTRVIAPSEPNIEGVKVNGGQEYNQRELGRKVQECTIFADIFREWEPFKERAAVCFVPGIKYGRDLEGQFNFLLGPGSAKLIHAKTKHEDRQQAFEDVEMGRTKVLLSVDVLREGWDLPVISLGMDLQPNKQLRSYWQKVGRIKREYPGQTDAVLLDFAGNYWRFPHPDEDPKWPTGKDTTQDLIEHGRKERGDPQPFMCPGCGEVRTHGKTCPKCGFECGEPIRRIRMGDGKLKEVPLRDKRKREKSDNEILLGKWQSCLYAGLYSNMTLGQVASMFQKRTGKYPSHNWPGVYPGGDINWRRKVDACFTRKSIAVQCGRAMRDGT